MSRCATKYCRNTAKKGKYCHGCVSRKSRRKNPIRYAYCTLKSNAKRRGKDFLLTFEQFKQFAVKTDYISKRGVSKKSLHIDRINENGPYSIENIQVLSNSENVKKYLRYKYNPITRQTDYNLEVHKITAPPDNAPF